MVNSKDEVDYHLRTKGVLWGLERASLERYRSVSLGQLMGPGMYLGVDMFGPHSANTRQALKNEIQRPATRRMMVGAEIRVPPLQVEASMRREHGSRTQKASLLDPSQLTLRRIWQQSCWGLS